MIVVKFLFALFLPPVAAWLQVGITTHFWISVCLTLLGGVPGIVHAFWLIITDQQA